MYVAGLGPQGHLGRHSENGPQMCRFGAYGGQFSGFWTPLGKWSPDAPLSCLARATAALRRGPGKRAPLGRGCCRILDPRCHILPPPPRGYAAETGPPELGAGRVEATPSGPRRKNRTNCRTARHCAGVYRCLLKRLSHTTQHRSDCHGRHAPHHYLHECTTHTKRAAPVKRRNALPVCTSPCMPRCAECTTTDAP